MKAWRDKIPKNQIMKFLFFAMICVAYLELFIRGDVLNAFIWFVTHPHMFLLNSIAVLGILLLVHGLINRWKASAIITLVLVYLFGMVNSVKFKTLGQYYYPWDNSSFSELGGVMTNVVNIDFTKPLLFLAIGSVYFYWLLRRGYFGGKDLKLSAAKRLAAIFVAAALVGGLVYHKEWKLDTAINLAGVRNYAWAPVHSYQNNGSVVAYLFNYRMNYVEKPKDYSKEQIAVIVDEISAAYTAEKKASSGETVKPNVIVVMSEALWDPNQLSKVHFSQNPMENLNKARKSTFVSPTFGGYTCNVEFEFPTSRSYCSCQYSFAVLSSI